MYAPYFKLYFTKNIYYSSLIRFKHLILDYILQRNWITAQNLITTL